MKKNLNKLATLALTGVLMTGMSFGALAESAALDDAGKANNVGGNTSLTFVKEVEVKDVDDTTKSEDVSAPDISFDYKVTAGTATTGTKTDGGKKYTYEIKAGEMTAIDGEKAAVTVGRADFNTNSTVTKVKDGSYCVTSANVTVDFSNVKFSDAGVYRYVIKETAKKYKNTDSIGDDFEYSESVSANLQTERAVDVFVSRQSDGTYAITGYEMYLITNDTVGTDKTKGYTIVDSADGTHNATGGNVYSTYDMTVQKKVVGALAQAKYDFTVKFDKIPSGAKYLYTDASTTVDLVEEPANFENFTSTDVANFKFANAGTIKVQGIPYEATATVNETDYSGSGYVTTGKVDNGTDQARSENGWSVGTNEKNESATALVVTNTLEDIPVTGVVMNIAPYAAMILGAGAFAGVFLGRKKSEDEE